VSGAGLRPVERAHLLELGAYEQVRPRFLARIIALKRRRRVALGSNATALFENHDTVLFQIQEMLRTERITQPSAIQHELDTYNALVPGERELSATIFLEYPDPAERERRLVELAGIESCFFVTAGGERCRAPGAPHGERRDRTTAVHYVRFPLGAQAVQAVRAARGPIEIGIDHPALPVGAELSVDTLASLAEDYEE
jgi:hypothetical protein